MKPSSDVSTEDDDQRLPRLTHRTRYRRYFGKLSTIATSGADCRNQERPLAQPNNPITCLAFADDLVLIADDAAHLQDLLDVCSRTAEKEGMKFSREKTNIMKIGDDTPGPRFFLQNEEVKDTTSYTYLGIQIESKEDYLLEHEQDLLRKMNKKEGHSWHLARHSFNPYEIGRLHWKTTAVPAATYANEAISYSKTTMDQLERQQRELGRWLLQGSFATPNPAIEGELGWSTYSFREARSKTNFLGRAIHGPEQAYITRVFRYLRFTGVKIHWIKKIKQIDRVYSIGTKRHTATNQKEWTRITRKELHQTESQRWTSSVARRKSMARYGENKTSPAPERFYWGDRASGLLFQARTGSLPTRKRISELFSSDNPVCTLCDTGEEEDLEHILRSCPALEKTRNPNHYPTKVLLGFQTGANEEDEPQIATTKRHLLAWEKATRLRKANTDRIWQGNTDLPTSQDSEDAESEKEDADEPPEGQQRRRR
ncbi:uncharacterized protein LOC135398497 [Ornithodoros turicata]|uniref:uncharacterized protein LOC135398497 n=1 Tax=Ornithodoros turicata TaxID=34597 RepID=UPI003138B43C